MFDWVLNALMNYFFKFILFLHLTDTLADRKSWKIKEKNWKINWNPDHKKIFLNDFGSEKVTFYEIPSKKSPFVKTIDQSSIEVSSECWPNCRFLFSARGWNYQTHCIKNKVFFSKWDQIHGFLWIWSHLLEKSLKENFIFCAVSWLLLSSARFLPTWSFTILTQTSFPG